MHQADWAGAGYFDPWNGLPEPCSGKLAYSGKPLPTDDEISELQRVLFREVFSYIGIASRFWGFFKFILWRPTRQLCQMAWQFDHITQQYGLGEAARSLSLTLLSGLWIDGCEKIPRQGPVVIAANHPGGVDFLALLSSIPRNDLKMIGRDNPFFRRLPAVQSHLIFSQRDPFVKMNATRQCLRHLRQGGALLVFATGMLDPDPACMSGAQDALLHWSPSLALFLEKVPDVRLQLACVSGVLDPTCLRHPISRLGRSPRERQLLAEIIHISRMFRSRNKTTLYPRVVYGDLLSQDDFGGELGQDPMVCIALRNKRLLTISQQPVVLERKA